MAFTETERLIGDGAKNQVAMNPTNTVFDAKRLIGRRYDDPTIQKDMAHWPFKVVNVGGKPKVMGAPQNPRRNHFSDTFFSFLFLFSFFFFPPPFFLFCFVFA